jgi:hypothetical protein
VVNSHFLKQPIWRAGAAFVEEEAGFSIKLRRSSCLIECNEESRVPLRKLFQALDVGLARSDIDETYGDFAEYAVGVIDQLDRFGYLTDAVPSDEIEFIDASTFRRHLSAVIEGAQLQVDSPFTGALLAGAASRRQLVQYAVEYFHIVRHAPTLVAPVLNWPWDPGLRARLTEFVGEEWRHYKLLQSSLNAVQVDVPAATSMLPSTFAVLSQLGVRATTDPLALASLLQLFEQPNHAFHEAFETNCLLVGLPGEFSDPILRHAEMNDGGKHEEIADALIKGLCPVSRERAQAALSDAVVAVEHLARLDAAIAAI